MYVKALELVDLSNQIISLQDAYNIQNKALFSLNVGSSLDAVHAAPPLPQLQVLTATPSTKICIAIPVTSRHTVMTDVKTSPLWNNFFDSFMKSIDWRSNRYVFKVYVGFDKADDIYDTGDAWSEMREEFTERATFRMREQLMDDTAIHSVLRDTLSLKLMHFEHLEGAPSQVVSQLMISAYDDNYDYFYQVRFNIIWQRISAYVIVVFTCCMYLSLPGERRYYFRYS